MVQVPSMKITSIVATMLVPIFLVCVLSVSSNADSENIAQKLKQEIPRAETVPYSSPNLKSSNVYFSEHFDNVQEFKRKWIPSKAKKPDVSEDLAQYDGKWEQAPLERFPLRGDHGLALASESRHSAIVAKFSKPFLFDGKRKFIVQYVVTFQKTVDCGGAYLKLLTDGALKDLTLFNDKTPYTIMFGPDKCGGAAKMHFIIRHQNPINGTIVEKHCTKLKVDDLVYKDVEPHLLKLVIEPDNKFSFYVDDDLQYSGNLLDEEVFNPPINPPKEIVDESDVKPKDWDDRAKIPDPDAIKPDDWNEDEPAEIPDPNAVKPEGWLEDEPLTIPDEEASKPQDWDEEMDGEWEPPLVENKICKEAPGCGSWAPPMIDNPKFKGKWKPPMIDNPDYKGKWVPRKIPNPDYYFDETPLKHSPIGYVGFELWSLVNKVYFDDILITDSETVSNEWTSKTWKLKKQSIAAESVTWKGKLLKALNFHPGWWLLYAIYCAIPIACYVMYMHDVIRKVKKRKNFFSRETSTFYPMHRPPTASFYKMFVDYTNNYPWLWAVYVLILAIVVGLIGACCLRLRRNKDDFEKESLLKKTDEYQPDDELSNKAADGPTAEGSETKTTDDAAEAYDDETDPDEKNSKSSSDEVNEVNDDLNEDEEENEVPEKPARKGRTSKSCDENEEEASSLTSSPRKRKPRRD